MLVLNVISNPIFLSVEDNSYLIEQLKQLVLELPESNSSSSVEYQCKGRSSISVQYSITRPMK